MRTGLLILLVLHGLIHLMGPAKAFGWAELPQLRLPISRPAGLLWLAAALLLLVGAAALITTPEFPAREWWWLATLPAVVLSQALIIQSWSDAKFGTFANIIILVPAVISALGAMPSSYRSTYLHEIATHLDQAGSASDVVTEADLAALPSPVQRYLRFMEVVGRPRVRNFHVTFQGGLRGAPDSAWMPSVADQYSFFGPSSRLFLVKSARYGVPFEALHIFTGPAATMQVKVASLVTVVDARGAEMNQSETVTLFNDMCLLAPASLVDAPVVWSDASDQRVRARFTRGDHGISAVLTFGDDGALENFESEDRYRSTDGKVYTRARWSTPIEQYRIVDGVKVPAVAEARWAGPSGEFAYARFEIVRIQYNLRPTGAP